MLFFLSGNQLIIPPHIAFIPYMLPRIDTPHLGLLRERQGGVNMANTKRRQHEANSTLDKTADYAREAADRVSDAGQVVADNLRQMGRKVQSRMEEIELDEATIPDAFRTVPKVISPKVHAWLDAAVTTYFLGLGVWFAIRGKGRAAAAAFVNGTMVAGLSMLTDYEGDGKKPVDFKMHGTMDAVQMMMAGLGPVMHGFAGEPEAKYFYGQAANELAVISTTDWDAGLPARSRRRAA